MRLLTKSRFKIGLECPNKLFYTKKGEYANTKNDDAFLAALAEGGFQVEEYARMHYPDGVLVDNESESYDYEKLWQITQELLKQENVTIYEAAFKFENLFIRTDILKKVGNRIELIEVKAKSCAGEDERFTTNTGGLVSKWKPYLFDVAFQKYVIQKCFPSWRIESNLMLTDKTKRTSINGLNQLFRISQKENNRTGITKLVERFSDTGNSVLIKVPISDIVEGIITGTHLCLDKKTFEEALQLLSVNYERDIFSHWPVTANCKKCEFKTTNEAKRNGLKSGFEECFSKVQGWQEADFQRPNILDVWDLRNNKLFGDNLLFKDQLDKNILKVKDETGKISRTARQWLQVEKDVNSDTTFEVFKNALKNEIDALVYPLHFIDFETSMVALPFNENQRPYEQIAFQFSHHVYYQDGRIEHKDQYINCEKGVFPNFHFVRALKQALNTDQGSIFRYSDHENTVLNQIRVQLLESTETDKGDLIEFIESICHPTGNTVSPWDAGPRDMVDLWVWIKDYYYNPLTKGSNSIKSYLPAALETSGFLKRKYVQSINSISVSSLNLNEDHIWLNFDSNGRPIDPYKSLPPVFENWSEEDLQSILSEIDSIDEGGAALVAYAKLQYTDISEEESKAIQNALYKYCELDTLAMVMIFEHLKEITV